VREADLIRGRREFAFIIAMGAGVLLLIGLTPWLLGGELRAVATFGRPIVLAGLGGLAWEGRGWARTAATIWLAFLAIVTLFSAVALVGARLGAALLFFAVGLGIAALAVRLQTSAAIDAALQARQRRQNTPAANPPAA
jgi:hypothetical protein